MSYFMINFWREYLCIKSHSFEFNFETSLNSNDTSKSQIVQQLKANSFNIENVSFFINHLRKQSWFRNVMMKYEFSKADCFQINLIEMMYAKILINTACFSCQLSRRYRCAYTCFVDSTWCSSLHSLSIRSRFDADLRRDFWNQQRKVCMLHLKSKKCRRVQSWISCDSNKSFR